MQAGLIAAALVCAVAPFHPEAVERWYSGALYPRIQHLLTPLSNLFPFALFDPLTLVASLVVIVTLVRAFRRARAEKRWSPVGAALGRLVTAAAVVYLVFLAVWGLNYRRVPMTERLEIERAAPKAEDVVQLGLDSVAQLNALYADAHAEGWEREEWRDEKMGRAFASVQRLLSDAPPAVPGRLKATIYGPYFRWTSVDGMVDPLVLEVIANPDLLPFERPFVAAHEWAHLAGYADESEANFVGWLTCLRAGPAAQYSGWLYLYWQVISEVGHGDRARVARALDEGPRRDLNAIAERLRRGQLPLLRNASWLVYDQYLRANRVEEGVRSYGEVVTLILRARFDEGWTPVRRGASPSR